MTVGNVSEREQTTTKKTGESNRAARLLPLAAPRWAPTPTMDRPGAFSIYPSDPEIFLPQKSRGLASDDNLAQNSGWWAGNSDLDHECPLSPIADLSWTCREVRKVAIAGQRRRLLASVSALGLGQHSRG